MTGRTRREFLIQSAGALGAMAILPDLSAAAPRRHAPLKVGLIGAGRQGRAIVVELQKIDGLTIAAMCDTDESRLNAGVRRAPGAQPYPDHRALLDNKDVQAVFIATPTHQHTAIALDAIAAGKHVYCEAPLAHTVDDCRRLAAAAATARTTFAVGLEGRSNPVYQLARTFYRSDSVREPVAIEAQNYQKTSWRFAASGPDREKEVNWRLDPQVSLGLAGELGVHQFDVMHWYTDKYPQSVRGGGAVRAYDDGRTIADTARCELVFPAGGGGLVGAWNASLGNSYGGRFEVFRGVNAAIKLAWSHGWMFKEADAPTQGWEVYANRQQFHNDEGITLIAGATKLAEQGKLKEGVGLPHPSLFYALSDFVKAASEGGHVACDAAAGARSTIVAILAARAVAEGASVQIDPALLKAGS
jgi:predicted dehydrogenase